MGGFKVSFYLLQSAVQQQGTFLLGVEGEYGIHVFLRLLVLLHLYQCLGAQQACFYKFCIQRNGFGQVGNAHQSVAFSVTGTPQQVVGHGVSFFYADGLRGGFTHGGVVVHHATHVGQSYPGGSVFGFQCGHALQGVPCLFKVTEAYMDLGEVVHGFEIFAQCQCFGVALQGIVQPADALRPHAVILEYFELLLFFFLLFGFRVFFMAGKE